MAVATRGAAAPTSGTQDHVALDTASLDTALSDLSEHRDDFAMLSPRERADLLEKIVADTFAAAEEWNAAACRAKGFAPNSKEAAEEMTGGIGTFLSMAQAFRRSMIDISEKGRPQYPGPVTARPDDRISIQVLPGSGFDKLLFSGTAAEVWFPSGVTESDVQAQQAAAYRSPMTHAGISLVLGAGNVASLGPRDVLTKMFDENKVVLLKANPVNDYLVPHWQRAMKSLIEAGYLRIVTGGAAVGAYLTQHSLVTDIHVTGSDKTHDAIVFGVGEEGARRKAANDPVVTKPVSCELGNVSPVVIVPGQWSDSEIRYQAEHVATMLTNNAGFNCLTPRVIVTHAAWAQRTQFLDALEAVLAELPTRRAYYPGAHDRHQSFMSAHPDAHQIGEGSGDKLPWTVVRNVDPKDANGICLNVEAFCALTSETALDSPDVATYVKDAVTFCNETVWGTLSMTLIAHPTSLSDPVIGPAIERAVADLRYGSIGVNIWHAMSFAFSVTVWGAYPGHPITDIQSGTGFVGNAFLFGNPQKSVVRGPFVSKPKPAWFATSSSMKVSRGVIRFTAAPSLRNLARLMLGALRG